MLRAPVPTERAASLANVEPERNRGVGEEGEDHEAEQGFLCRHDPVPPILARIGAPNVQPTSPIVAGVGGIGGTDIAPRGRNRLVIRSRIDACLKTIGGRRERAARFVGRIQRAGDPPAAPLADRGAGRERIN